MVDFTLDPFAGMHLGDLPVGLRGSPLSCRRGWINITDLGACPGTDATAAFIAAFDLVERGLGGTVYVPTGAYLLRDELSLVVPSNTTIIGDGARSVIVRLPSAGSSGVVLNANDTSGVRITNLAIDCRATPAPVWEANACITGFNSFGLMVITALSLARARLRSARTHMESWPTTSFPTSRGVPKSR